MNVRVRDLLASKTLCESTDPAVIRDYWIKHARPVSGSQSWRLERFDASWNGWREFIPYEQAQFLQPRIERSVMQEEPIRDVVETVRGDHDEDGFHLFIEGEDDRYDFRVADVETARTMLSQVSRLRSWIEEHDRERAAYDRATPEERQAVIEPQSLHVDRDEQMREGADLSRKAERENRA